ncbi:uracil-DNA glycosylase [Sporosarcina sp. HYO08]|uniref:uracil-DNA glycosylase n=1 Tax=Sporosarcina sp. HYO08 TaxID=1759557 RepID=UPI000792D779|nr:uracil-DNA glycosylase [Sporosarcina sp. HYO08]KXH83923.1 uracil-DNA glycosylase [Sporosarcina sp. HYO08]
MQKKFFMNKWDDVLKEEFTKPYYTKLREFLKKEYEEEIVYPPMDHMWSAFQHTSFDDVKVVILGQDPYHGEGQAHGLSFSVQPGVKIPPSLRNMFKELTADIGCPYPESGTLTGWAKQGVLMLNTVLTVREGQAHSHRRQGWEQFTDEVIRKLSAREKPIVFVLWGRPAGEKKKLIDQSRHAIVESVHPSPLSASRGFLGSRPYSAVNQILESWNERPIDWCQTNSVS